jgi:hypothetical protein
MIYLAAPYKYRLTNDPEDDYPDVTSDAIEHARFCIVTKYAANLIHHGKNVYSPITHTHPMCRELDLPTGWEFWKKFDLPFLDICDEIYVLKLPGWDTSKGISEEVKIMKEQGKPVTYIEKEMLIDA